MSTLRASRRRFVCQVLLVVCFIVTRLLSSSPPSHKPSKSDRDINAIGHRNIALLGANWYSIKKEQEIGAQASARFEQSVPLLKDEETEAYLDHLTQTIALNSDAKLPITVRVIDSEDVYALTLPGGYQYITLGLLLRLQSEGEVASALARGIAHTALRSELSESNRAIMMKVMSVPMIFTGEGAPVRNMSDGELATPITLLSFKRAGELAADYFGVQYVYKAGHDPECFIHFVQVIWPAPASQTRSDVFSQFPEPRVRVDALEKEMHDILPSRDRSVKTTRGFEQFRKHLLTLHPIQPQPAPRPSLLGAGPKS